MEKYTDKEETTNVRTLIRAKKKREEEHEARIAHLDVIFADCPDEVI